ncbi:hypothetical protein O7606_00795 [Micromonospora sp. WMMD882]|uniref:hypothetical protein n=1 Tax=Micromonospora sp. WMMD882 TaxID=3015151 RepID=UPI00248B9435|nr:hypothetical protein [Micromonospora sp. WMMD882]WBB79980.1 hypothetical protein O7606_00795 [Micromonospora sp. WMMD882]
MATFHQQHQTVQYQINGETVHVNGDDLRLVKQIDELIAQVGRGRDAAELTPVVHCLEEARTASARGDRAGAVTLLRRAAELAGPVATIVTGIVAVAQGFQ